MDEGHTILHRRLWTHHLVLSALIGVLTLLPVQSSDAASEPDARGTIKGGAVELGALAGYWQATDLLSATKATNRSAVYFLPQVGWVLHDPFDAGSWSGNFTLFLEPQLAHYFQPFSASAFGGVVGLKYNFLSYGRWVPFWDLGVGGLWTDLAPRIRELSTQGNFLLQSGPGLQYFMTRTTAWTFGIRLHHSSNAGLGARNLGLNAALMYVGMSFYLND